MLSHMHRVTSLVLVLLAAACTPAVSSPSPSPSISTAPSSSSATATASPAPTASPSSSATPIPLPTFAQLAAAGNGVVWAFVNGDHLFRSTDRGDTWVEHSLPQLNLPNA